jgi:chloride channel protein, CIC family
VGQRGAARAPITAVLIIFELTGEYQIILPLMFAIALAAGVSNLLSRDTIYTLKLRRRGIDIVRGRRANLMEVLRVRDALEPVPEPLLPDLPLQAVVARFARESQDALPVVDHDGLYRGSVTASQLEAAMRDNALDATAGELAIETATLDPAASLERALQELVTRATSGLPVVAEGGRVIGWLSHVDVLRAYARKLDSSLTGIQAAPHASGTLAGTPAPRLHGFRVVDLQLAGSESPVGQRLQDLRWPPSVLLLALRRGAQVVEPGPETELRQGDHLTVLAPAGQADRVVEAVRAGSARS